MLRLPAAPPMRADKLNYLQFLTIRQFLSVVFVALIGLLVILMFAMLVWS